MVGPSGGEIRETAGRASGRKLDGGFKNDTVGFENDTIGFKNDTAGFRNDTFGFAIDTTGFTNETGGGPNMNPPLEKWRRGEAAGCGEGGHGEELVSEADVC